MARHSCAIARRWDSKVDIVVKGLLKGPLLGYYGIGTIQSFEDETADDLKTRVPAADVMQIYIPGLREKNPLTGARVYADAFEHLEQTRIGWDPL